MHHQLGHVEKRKKNRVLDKWTMAEWGNWIADGIAGNARKQAEREELEWNVQVDAWNAKVDRREATGGVTRPVVKPIRKRTAPLLPAWRLASSMQWVLCWENLEVVGPTASWVRETPQKSYSTEYLRKQPAGLFRPCSLANVDFDALVGQSFLLDGENWEVVEADASTRLVKYARATTEHTGDVGPAENDTDDELGDATGAADTTEIRVEEALALLGADDDDQPAKVARRRCIARTLTCDSFGTCGPAKG